jgi:hypothetical protein
MTEVSFSEDFKQFYLQVLRVGDAEVNQRLSSTRENPLTIDELHRRVVELGAAKGFHFTSEEVRRANFAKDIFLESVLGDDDELSDRELEIVAGGNNEQRCVSFDRKTCCENDPANPMGCENVTYK